MSTSLLFQIVARAILFTTALAIAAPAAAEPLTVRVGESWLFAVRKGEPVRARRVQPAARPALGEIKVTLSAMAGTTMTLTNNSRTSYTFVAELMGVPAPDAGKRTCTLPPKLPTIEYWPVKAPAVRLSNFKPATEGGNCPD